MPRTLAVRCLAAILVVGGCALVVGCVGGNQGYLTGLISGDDSSSPDARAHRIVLRPETHTASVRGTQVLIATVYDRDGKPRPRQRVEWMIEGPGSIVEFADNGDPARRGLKVDNKYGSGLTESSDRRLTRGRDQFTLGPGQTWCVVTAAVEGQTTVTAYCPAINDWERNRAYGKVNWVDADLKFPGPVTTRAGGEHTLITKFDRPGDRAGGYRVRYRILDGPAAALAADDGSPVKSVTEAVTPVEDDGSGRVKITQPLPANGTNRVAIEIVKPDPEHPGQFTVVSSGETRITWQAPKLDVRVSAPKAMGVNQDVTVRYTVGGTDDPGPITLTARVPPEMVLIKTEPKAAFDGDTLIWTLDKPQSVSAIVRPVRLGGGTLLAEARSEDGVSGRATADVSITEAKLVLKLDGPTTGMVGDPLTYRVTVTNAGDAAADRIRVQTKLDDGLETANRASSLDEPIASIPAGQSRTIPLSLLAQRRGQFGIEVKAAGERGLTAVPQSATIEIKDAQLSVSAHGPSRGYVGQEVTWELVIQNGGDVALTNVVVKATLPAEVAFVRASDGGRVSGKQVVWDAGTAPRRQEKSLRITAICNTPTKHAALSATVSGTPTTDNDRDRPKPVGTKRPAEAALEIVGLPALQLSMKDSVDPVLVGQRTTYLVRVKNAGTSPARRIEVVAEMPMSLRPTRGTGPGANATIDAQKVTFPAIDTLAPGAEASLVIEAEARIAGETQLDVQVRSPSQTQPLRAVEPTRIIPSESQPRLRQ